MNSYKNKDFIFHKKKGVKFFYELYLRFVG
jgi:hypothetical protein